MKFNWFRMAERIALALADPQLKDSNTRAEYERLIIEYRRNGNEALLAARLTELDTSRGGNLTRAIRYNNRRAELSRYKIYGAYIYPAQERTGYTYAVVGPVFSYH